MSRYDEIVQALTELNGEAKLQDIHKKILDNVAIRPPSKGTVAATLRNFQESKEGKKFSFQTRGKGVWKLVQVSGKRKVMAKNQPKSFVGAPAISQRLYVPVEDLQLFIDQILEPLKKDGGKISIAVEVIYRPKAD